MVSWTLILTAIGVFFAGFGLLYRLMNRVSRAEEKVRRRIQGDIEDSADTYFRIHRVGSERGSGILGWLGINGTGGLLARIPYERAAIILRVKVPIPGGRESYALRDNFLEMTEEAVGVETEWSVVGYSEGEEIDIEIKVKSTDVDKVCQFRDHLAFEIPRYID